VPGFVGAAEGVVELASGGLHQGFVLGGLEDQGGQANARDLLEQAGAHDEELEEEMS